MAKYNQLMNQRQYAIAGKLSEVSLCQNKGVFFKSVLGTLNHILVGDIIWLKRFSAHPSSGKTLSYISKLNKPKSLDTILFKGFNELNTEREKIDTIIIKWANQLSMRDIKRCVSYSDMSGKPFNKPLASLINHLFLHQTHHRGQVTALLSQFGMDFGETDIIEIIDECEIE